ncbi:hypothetical protein AB0L63_25665 [Nocardia sp. NPDC051990]|uniref:hypothetical protein n=1 Tax=Nocardia sp. NPDC051990 TaxID=3155285 RepID=UPI003436178E
MALEVDPAHLPVVSSQLDLIADQAIASLAASAATCVVHPPAWDIVSAVVLPLATATYGVSFFSCTGEGFVHREVGSASLPSTALAYSGSDVMNSGTVASIIAAITEEPW